MPPGAERCTCASIRPGSSVLPEPSTTSARIQPVDLSPGPERSSRSGKGQKTTLKRFSVSYYSSNSGATHQACAPIQNEITNNELEQPKLTDLCLGRSNCWRSAAGGKIFNGRTKKAGWYNRSRFNESRRHDH